MINCAECSHSVGYGRAMPGEKGWRSPLPEWWVAEANDRLARRQLEKKTFARALTAQGHAVSEMMVLRALHPNPSKRVATIETLDAISDALNMPRPVVVAATYADALELQRTVSFGAADAERLRISAAVDRENELRSAGKPVVDGGDGRATRNAGAVDAGRAKVDERGPAKVRRAPRTR
jgi:hypothetical protein